tara:strand:+ start:3099 stop:3626 length:528 start_codon:yes stop_codon:yes gene_type:complete
MRVILILILILSLSNCKSGSDARKIPPNVKDRQLKNIEEGRGFRLMGNKKNTGEFDFASSNELWRASLDTLEFMPLALANYSGGILVTDWYANDDNNRESIKISIRFLSNEIRSDSVMVKVFYKNCSIQETCRITDKSEELSNELERKILQTAAAYSEQDKTKNKKKYINKALQN